MLSTAQPVTLSGPPLVGHLFEFRKRRLELQLRVMRECGDLGLMRIGPIPVYAVSSAELAHQILVEHADAFVKSRGLGKIARPMLGDGLLTSEHELHRRQRKLHHLAHGRDVVARDFLQKPEQLLGQDRLGIDHGAHRLQLLDRDLGLAIVHLEHDAEHAPLAELAQDARAAPHAPGKLRTHAVGEHLPERDRQRDASKQHTAKTSTSAYTRYGNARRVGSEFET